MLGDNSGWATSTLRPLLNSYIGGGWGSELPDEQFTEAAAVFRGTDIPDSLIGRTTGLPRRFHKMSNLRSRRLEPGDIVFEVSGGSNDQPVGRSLYCSSTLLASVGEASIPASFCKRLVPNPAVVDGRFLFYFLRSIYEDRRVCQWQVQSTGISNFQFEAFLDECTIQLPTLNRQCEIASILSAYDDLIENTTRRGAILEEMARRIFEEWFVRFRFPGHETVPMVNSALGLAPEGWEVRPFAEVATITMGLSPGGDTYNAKGAGTPLVNGPVEFGEKFTKKVKWTTAPTKLCNEDDLIVCVRGSTTGKHVKSDGVYCLGRGVCGISSKYQCFVDLLFAHELPALLGQTSGSTFPSWTGPQLKSHPVLVPPTEVLNRFESYIRPMSAGIGVYTRQIQNLCRTRDLLLPKLISGELDVSELLKPEAIAA